MLQTRLSLDIPKEKHTYIKLASAKLGMSMKEFALQALDRTLEELEDKWTVEKAEKILDDIKSGKRKTIDWDELKSRMLTDV